MDTLTAWARALTADAYSLRTVHHRTRIVGQFARAAGVSPLELTRDHVVDYLTRRDYAPRTRESYLTSLRLFCAWAGLEDVTLDIRRGRIPRGVPRPITEAALGRMLLAAPHESPVRVWILLGAFAGLRSMETAKVRAQDLEETGDGHALRVVGKAGVEGLIPVPWVVVDALRPWMRAAGGRGRLWPDVSPKSVQDAIRRVGRAAQVDCSSHQLRHRYGTAVYAESKDLLLTQQVMRHANPATTAGYALVVADRAAAVVARLPGAGRAVGGTRG